MKQHQFSPNLIGQIYTYIYLAAANKQISRKNEALACLRLALDMAMPDKVYMPFVENCDYIKQLLEEIQSCNIYSKDIEAVFQLYRQYSQAFNHIAGSQFTSEKPQLADREMKVAILAAEGLSNLEIGKRLFISQNTVKTQLKSVFKKLGIHSRALLKYNTGIN